MRFDYNFPSWQWPFYIMRHPFEGFEDLRWQKTYNALSATLIIFGLFIMEVLNNTTAPFLHRYLRSRLYNVIPDFSSTIILFLVWVLANWAICTLFDGEGTMKRIYCVTGYAFLPMLLGKILMFGLYFILGHDEDGFLFFVDVLSSCWSYLMLFTGMKTVHQFTPMKTLLFILLTVGAMAVILVLLVLLASLFQQVYLFVYSIFTELLIRFPKISPISLGLIFAAVFIVIIAVIVGLVKFGDYRNMKKEEKLLMASGK